MNRFTANWKLNHEKSSSQCELLRCLGRNRFQQSVIDKADEDFALFHFYDEEKKVHFFEKNVIIYLLPTIVDWLQRVMPFLTIELNRVEYSHQLVANGKHKAHEEDQKQFGKCTSVTTWDESCPEAKGVPAFTIRWYLSNGILKVIHFVDDEDRLTMLMDFANIDGSHGEATKKFDRHEFPDHLATKLKTHKYFRFLKQ